MQHPCRTGGATKLFYNMALPCPIPFRLQMVVWGPGSCIFFFFSYKDLDDSYDQAVVESTGSESSTVLLTVTAGAVAVFLLHQCPAALEGHDYCVENSIGMPVCRAVSASRKRISNRVSSGVRSTRPESIFFFVLIFFFEDEIWKRNLGIP